MLVLATGSGSLILSHVNDSGFWLVQSLFKMEVKGTLATWSIWGGVAYWVLPEAGGNPAPQMATALLGTVWRIPESVIFFAVLVVAWMWARRTTFIKDLWAIGSDKHRARLSGVPLARRLTECYAVIGVLAALAGIWVTASTATGDPAAGNPYILDSVAAVVLGGTSLFGGPGSAGRSLLGALVLVLIPNLVYALQLQSFWSVFIEGVLLIVAVTASSLARGVRGFQ
jgi:ribose transport system permease protein